jgi:hypothetical protein
MSLLSSMLMLFVILSAGMCCSFDRDISLKCFRALQFPPEGWLRISIGNTGITWLVIRPNGNVSLRYLGEIGHLHPDKLTFT